MVRGVDHGRRLALLPATATGAFGPGKTITLTDENLVISGRSATDRERTPYRAIDHARCADLSTTTATIVIRSGRVEKQFHSARFQSLPDFYAFWSALRSRLQATAVQADDPESFERHGSEQRAIESLLGWKWVAACGLALAVVAAVYVIRHRLATVDRPPVAARAPVAAPVIASSPQGVFLAESIVTRGQADLERLHLPLESKSWVVDRRNQVYFVPQGGGPHDIPYLFALVLPREGITVQIEGRMQAGDVVEPGLADLGWDIISVKVPNQHAARQPHAAWSCCGGLCKPTAITAICRGSERSG